MPERSLLLSLLEKYEEADELNARDQIITFVKKNADCFLRSNLKGHITGSCWLLDQSGQEVLLCHHKKLNCWLQLGGHADGDFDILAVALKEAREESGILAIEPVSHEIFDVDVHEIPEHKGVPKHFHYDVRFLLRAQTKDFLVSDESNALAWIKVQDVLNGAFDESLVRMAKKFLRVKNK